MADKLIEIDPAIDSSRLEFDNLHYRRTRLLNQINTISQSHASNQFYSKYDTNQSQLRKSKRSKELSHSLNGIVTLNKENIAIYPIDETNPNLCNQIQSIITELQPENIFLPLRSGHKSTNLTPIDL